MRKIINLFIFLIFISKLFAQTNTYYPEYYFKNFPNSPSTATFLRYGEIQNNEFIGANSPKIDIFNINEGSISFPISIDYISGNGIKVADEASNVGLGWNLGIPTITQSVLGYDDFDEDENHINLKIDFHYENTPWPALNYNGKFLESKEVAEPSGYIHQPGIGNFTYYYSSHYVLPSGGYFQQYNNAVQYDTSPDIFTVNLFGKKLQFVLNNFELLNSPNNASPTFTSLNKGYKITYNNQEFFTIIAPDGLKYIFAKYEKVKMGKLINRNYMLTKITDTNNNSVFLTYKEYSNILNFVPFSKNLNYTVNYTTTTTNSCHGIPVYYGGTYVFSSTYNGIYPPNTFYPYTAGGQNGSFYTPPTVDYSPIQNYLYISEISGNFGIVKFNYNNREDTDTQKLSSIQIYASNDPQSQQVKTVDFSYSYFTSSRPSPNPKYKKRLKLLSVKFNEQDEYNFSYQDNYPLPPKDSYAVDYWGYYNGGDENKTYFLNPADFSLNNSIPTEAGKNDNKKLADITYCTSGLLKRIIYPTRGFSDFEYELNSSDNLTEYAYKGNFAVGKGVRIKKQTNKDSDNQLIDQIEYNYEGGYTTNPLSLIKSYYSHFLYSNHNTFNSSILSMNSTNNYSASPLSSGDYVGYYKVEKKRIGNANVGKITTYYNITPDVGYMFYSDQLPVNIPSSKGEGVESGTIKEQIIYDEHNNPIKRITNQYSTVYSNFFYGTTLNMIDKYLFVCSCITNGNPCSDGSANINWLVDLSVVAHYPIFSKESMLSSTQTTEYINARELVTNTTYNYNSYNFLQTKTTNTPSGENIAENYTYTSGLSNHYNNNILSKPVEKNVVYNNKLISKQRTSYGNPQNFNPTSLIDFRIDRNYHYETRITFDQYDSKGNLLQYTTKSGIPAAIIWGYNKIKPIAKIEGATYPDASNPKPTDIPQPLINTIVNSSNTDMKAVPNSDESSLLTVMDNFRISLPDYQVTTYTYDPLVGVRSITYPSGIREVYVYDSIGRLKQIRENNQNGSILKEYSYNNSPRKFRNDLKSQPFIRNNCGLNYIGGSYTYTVPADKYSSYISQEDADLQAQNDINANGQNKANINGTCRPAISCAISMQFSGGGGVVETISNYKATVGFSTGSNSINLPWTTGVKIGTIQGICKPAVNHEGYNGQVYYTILTNGDIIIKSQNGVFPNNITKNYEFNYPIN